MHNNWGHNPKAIAASADTRRKQFSAGERTMWSKGKSIKTNTSLQAAAKKLSDRYTPEIKQEYSNRMRKMRLDGTIPTLYRENGSRWKGEVSEISQLARSDTRLYTEWKYPILIRDKFRCTKCGEQKNLHVHHDEESFSDIIRKVYDN